MGAVYLLHRPQQCPNAGLDSSIKIKTIATMLLCKDFLGDKSPINNRIIIIIIILYTRICSLCTDVFRCVQEFLITIN